jgi:hypothetical protein
MFFTEIERNNIFCVLFVSVQEEEESQAEEGGRRGVEGKAWEGWEEMTSLWTFEKES